MLSSMDPLLLAIPYLRASQRSVPLDDLLTDPDFPDISDLLPMLAQEKMSKIAKSKGTPDLNVWVYDEEKCLEYLSSKVDKLKKKVKDQGLTVLDNTSSINYVSAKRKDDSEEEEDAKRYAWEFISDFLQNDLSEKLAKHIKLDLSAQSKQPVAKKPKLDSNVAPKNQGPKDDYFNPKSVKNSPAPAVENSRQKALAKSAKGSKSISSFFSKK